MSLRFQGLGLILVAWVLTSAEAKADAVIEGRVKLPEARSTPVMNRRYEIVSKGGIIATNPPLAVVYLEGEFNAPVETPVVQLPQKDLAFLPALLPVRVGTRVEFPNLDDTYHNIFSYSPPKRFDLGRYLPEERPIPSQVFDVPGLVTLRCDIHEHMRGVILVLDTPHFVVTETDGSFRLTGISPGRYTVKAWINSKTTLEETVAIGAEERVEVDFR